MPDREASRWIRKAESDLLAADNNLGSKRVPYDVVCFHCQQAGEKLLKALLVDLGVPFPRTHDLMALLQAVRNVLVAEPPAAVRDACVILNPYAVEARYPDDSSDPLEVDAREAREAVRSVQNWLAVTSPSLFGKGPLLSEKSAPM